MSQLKWSQKQDQMQQCIIPAIVSDRKISQEIQYSFDGIDDSLFNFFFAFDCLYGSMVFLTCFFIYNSEIFFHCFLFSLCHFEKNNKKEITNFHLPILIQHYNATCVDVHTTTTCMTIIICDSRIFFPLHYQLHTLYIWYIKIQSIGIL